MLKKLMKWSPLLAGAALLQAAAGCDLTTTVTDLINQILGGVLPQ
jgi:hypothetical protein